MELTYGYKKRHIIVYGDGYALLGIKVRGNLGKIKYSSFAGLYQFYPSWKVDTLCEETIEELNSKMKELRKIRDRRTKK